MFTQTSSIFATDTATISCNLAPTTMILEEELTFKDSSVCSSFARPLIMIFCILLGTPIMSTSLSLSCPIVDNSGMETACLSLLCTIVNSTNGESGTTTGDAWTVSVVSVVMSSRSVGTFFVSSGAVPSSWPLIFSENQNQMLSKTLPLHRALVEGSHLGIPLNRFNKPNFEQRAAEGMAQRKFNLNSNRRPSSEQCYCLQATLGHIPEAYWTTRFFIVAQKNRRNNDNKHIYSVMLRTVSHTVFMWIIRKLRFYRYLLGGCLSGSRPVLQHEENSQKPQKKKK